METTPSKAQKNYQNSRSFNGKVPFSAKSCILHDVTREPLVVLDGGQFGFYAQIREKSHQEVTAGS